MTTRAVPARTLLTGGNIHSPADPHATAMAVEDGIVVWLGQDSVGRTLYENADVVVDLAGAFVAPAFVDAHVHATSAGLLRTGLDLTGCESLTECLDAIRWFVRDHGGQLIWGHGWDETKWPERRPPTRAELDAAAEGAALYLSRIDVHSALVSSALLDHARGAEGFSEDGPLTKDAHHRVRRAAQSAITPAQRADAQTAFLDHAASMGIASVHECAGPDISGADDFAELLARTSGPEVVGYWGERGPADLAIGKGARGLAGDLFVDGAIGSRTAALCHPYTDRPDTSGALYLDAAAIGEHLRVCTEAGIQAGFHVIGDGAVAEVIDGFAIAEKTVGREALAGARHRLEHLEMVTAEQAERLGQWGVVASVQPLFDAAWGGADGMYVERLGERGTTLNPFSRLAAAGVILALGSDAPVTRVDPWATVQAAVHHRTDGHGLSPRAAFTAHTRGGWRAAGVDDGLTGTLQPGAPATYAIWDAPELVSATADARVQRWSTDPRSRVPALPPLHPGADLPACLRTVLRGHTIFDRFDREEHHRGPA
ncbi:Exoenzymes regulatory protein AepA in lipid-linked oligosaccharide synthesis cluster [Alloactinosynnema sp. L-07]|uniref:amidohydrolase n=1 Tax=Alloactinosynnema sp. L-07 TaxID=1653480 RepID=UPI00065EF10F|nr:amidohydrolase [Alloactinosynnema sp. L-07]CRK56463.1 Exoenzymes regulatory protein AepA in lipid-linked oligosaccharide synthesis cluster [Alloactinosynnema sp. L-07]